MANQSEGTGKHGHKDTQEAYPHHHDQQQGGLGSQGIDGGAQKAQADRSGQQGGGSEDQSLQAREYRDEQSNIHHHTKTYMEQHEKGGSDGKQGDNQ